MKNRTSFYIVIGLILLAILGVVGSLISDPVGFLQNIAVIVVIGLIIFFLVRRFYKAGPQKREQQAFRKAAKKSKRRFQQKDMKKSPTKTGTLSTLKKASSKKTPSHLTVIEGKKGKKKNRASF